MARGLRDRQALELHTHLGAVHAAYWPENQSPVAIPGSSLPSFSPGMSALHSA